MSQDQFHPISGVAIGMPSAWSTFPNSTIEALFNLGSTEPRLEISR